VRCTRGEASPCSRTERPAAVGPGQGQNIAIFGPNAYPAVPVGGGSAAVEPFNSVSYLEGLSHFWETAPRALQPLRRLRGGDLDRTHFTMDAAGKTPGIRGEYSTVPIFPARPQSHRLAHQLRLDGESLQGRVVKGTSIRWTGYYTAGKTGSYDWLINFEGEDSARFFPRRRTRARVAAGANGAGLKSVQMERRTYAVKYEFVIGSVWQRQVVGLGAIAAEDLITPNEEMAAAADAAWCASDSIPDRIRGHRPPV